MITLSSSGVTTIFGHPLFGGGNFDRCGNFILAALNVSFI
jgi:hypothetical protein